MAFSKVVFGNINIISPGNATFTDGSSIPTGGLRLFIVPTINVGNNGIDLGFTYINQFGTQKTTSVTTAVAPNTTSGSHVQVVLEAGDTGIQDIISVAINPGGGSTGDSLSFESWNEGIGRPPIPITSTEPFNRAAVYPDGIPAHIFEPYIGLWKGKSFEMLDTFPLVPIMYYSDPQIPVPIIFSKSAITDWIPEVMTGREMAAILVQLADNVNARKEIVSWVAEPLSGHDYNARMLSIFRSWIESVVGQVLSGYVQNVDGQVIKNAFSVVLMSTAPTVTSPGGTSTTADTNPDTGLYQAFLKKVVYDSRYLIVRVGLKNVALQGAGIPAIVDGNQQLPLPYNLQFACPVKNCDFTITKKA